MIEPLPERKPHNCNYDTQAAIRRLQLDELDMAVQAIELAITLYDQANILE